MMKTIRFRSKNYRLTADEVEDLRGQLTSTPSKFVALNSDGHVVAEGNTVEVKSTSANGVHMTFKEDPDNSWNFFGDDYYTIVTRNQYDALVTAGLAHE